MSKTIEKTTKKRIKELCKILEETAINNIKRALNSGAIPEKSDFLKDNCLLASCLLENSFNMITLKHKEHIKESENIKKFI